MRECEKLPLKALRAISGKTQQEVATEVGVNKATYSSWENYKTYPDALQLIKLGEIFERSLDAFYFPHNTSFKLVNEIVTDEYENLLKESE